MVMKMKNLKINLGVLATSAVLLVGSLVPAQAAYQSNGSFGAVHLYNAGSQLATSYGWTSQAVGSSSAESSNAVFTCPATATGVSTFLASAANTSDPSKWDAFATIGFAPGTKEVEQPNLSPAAQVLGNAGLVKSSGGSFNLGVACTRENGVQLLSAYYRTITITAGTGAYTAVATATDSVGTSLPTPTWAVTTPVSPAPSNREAGSVYVGDVLTATKNEPTIFPGDYTTAFQWKRNGNAIANKTAATYTVVEADGYAKITVDVTYTAAGVSVTKASTQTPLVLGGSAVLGGNVSMSAGVSAIQNGFLELSVPANAAAVFTSPTIENNYSITRGTLGNIQINDSRWVTTDGWDLTADVDTFKDGTKEIVKSNFGLAPRKVDNLTTATGHTLGTARVAGSAEYPTAFASAAKYADLGNTGVTVLNADLTLRAPRTTLAGTYTSKVTLTLATK
jgi:hypothetical protein